MVFKEHSVAELAAQPVGYWSGATYRAVVGRIRANLAIEKLAQPHWWTLNHVSGDPGTWTRSALTERLAPYDDQDTDFEAVYDDLVGRGWIAEERGVFTLTSDGEVGLARTRERALKAHEQMHAGISDEEYAAALNVMRRIIANLGGNADLP